MCAAAEDATLERSSTPLPHSRILSNGRYTVLITRAGTGYSACGDLALSRWSADRTEDPQGFFVYLRDLDTQALWSLGRQPVQHPAQRYEVHSQAGGSQIRRLDYDIEACMELCVAPDDDIEIRRLSLSNHSRAARRLELTSYIEVVLGHRAADAAHPAFSKLFVQTEFVPGLGALLARRRPRSGSEHTPWMMHAAYGPGTVEHETDRARFVGRGRRAAEPLALVSSQVLSGTLGNVLDPIFSLRRVLHLPAGASVRLTLVLGAAQSREQALVLTERYAEPDRIERAFARAAQEEQDLARSLGITLEQAERFEGLAGRILYGDPALRARLSTAAQTPAAVLRHHGLSPQTPLVLADCTQLTEEGVREILRAYAYWHAKGLRWVLWLLHDGSPADLRRAIAELAAANPSRLADIDRQIALRERDSIPSQDLELIETMARFVVRGPLVVPDPPDEEERGDPVARPAGLASALRAWEGIPGAALQFFNGHGGFTEDGTEYLIQLAADGLGGLSRPPMPWINVVANERFGFLTSESGAGYTWSRNSREHRLTPWYNDPIMDPHGEAVYLRDEDRGLFWSPMPGPAPGAGPYEVRHGYGYTRFLHTSQKLRQETSVFVPRRDSVKITRVRLTNLSDMRRRLSIFAYQRLVLGVLPEDTAPFVITEFDSRSGAVLARNLWSENFADRVCFAAVAAPGGLALQYTCDRGSFIGPGGSPARPAALCGPMKLDGRSGAGLDPCIALQVDLEIPGGAVGELCFLLGEAESSREASSLIEGYRQPGTVSAAFDEVQAFWQETLGAVRIETPVRCIDLMVNGWLLYQTLSCRLWGRSAFYQSGGAFGFRDQLQDSAALIYAQPELARAQLLLHAAHQFLEGDVLHWWHPPLSRGIRTRFSDDLLWLPYLTAFYTQTTGDTGVLDEPVRFLTARGLAEGEDETYLLPADTGCAADLYEHCCRALDCSLTEGAHGLPLMGTGDWNDGMNRVGRGGRGESVWVGFFLYAILGEFIPICEQRGDKTRAGRYQAHRERLLRALEKAGWDGQWYRRAYYDDGTPLGSAQGDECRIDALAQAWAVISQAAPRERAEQAIDAVEEHLVSEREGLIRLLAPPFVNTPHDPGYIKGYVAGVRENGGQYTHAALWVVRALAELGRGERATALLEMLIPVSHARTAEQVALYQVEPYVVAADVYGASPHIGRGGWTWYTGSAAWMYRVALESVLGLSLVAGSTLRLRPRVPDTWPGYRIDYRLSDQRTRYDIQVCNPAGTWRRVLSATCDERPVAVEDGAAVVPLERDGALHRVCVVLG